MKARFGSVAMVAAALIVCAWYAVGARQAQDTARASALVAHAARLHPAQARRAWALLDAAAFLNPDRQVDILRAELDAGRGRPAAARRILDRVLAAEPQNVLAWVALARSSAGSPATFLRALRNFFALVPPFPAAR